MMELRTRHTVEQRELLLFDALRVSLGLVHGSEREEVRRSLRAAGMRPHSASDGCESWHWPGGGPPECCQHGFEYDRTEEKYA